MKRKASPTTPRSELNEIIDKPLSFIGKVRW